VGIGGDKYYGHGWIMVISKDGIITVYRPENKWQEEAIARALQSKK
jgi:hypothetical protein